MNWQPIETAPKDGTPILAITLHEADSYFYYKNDEPSVENYMLTPYAVHCEGDCYMHVHDGVHVIVWMDSYEESEGWEYQSYIIPGWWFLNGTEYMVTANPILWQPIEIDEETVETINNVRLLNG